MSMMSPEGSTYDIQQLVLATTEYYRERSEHAISTDNPRDPGSWDWPAPDLSLHAWKPKPPARNSRDAIHPERFAQIKLREQADGTLVNELYKRPPDFVRSKPSRDFITVFHTMRPYTAKRHFVKQGGSIQDHIKCLNYTIIVE
ncbi:hypothetical protein FGIG_10643 [Fasciola gigantica]|uniref:Uncharacterized protein n=1 Tax=Fasciola gigantica TaxID=46835 RepID=A0A504YRR7_FASGI|nr:hypothetical protein FGIG_10643 [Fasciola gigantica]